MSGIYVLQRSTRSTIDCYRRSVNAVDFKARAQYNNLSPAEKEALIRLSKRRDIAIKAADKGGAVVVWSAFYTSPKQIVNCPMVGSTSA